MLMSKAPRRLLISGIVVTVAVHRELVSFLPLLHAVPSTDEAELDRRVWLGDERDRSPGGVARDAPPKAADSEALSRYEQLREKRSQRRVVEESPRLVGRSHPQRVDWEGLFFATAASRSRTQSPPRVVACSRVGVGNDPCETLLIPSPQGNGGLPYRPPRQEIGQPEELYQYGKDAAPFEDAECEALAPWQLTTYTSCNPIHGVSIRDQLVAHADVRRLGTGTWRETWLTHDDAGNDPGQPGVAAGGKLAFKTYKYGKLFDPWSWDKHRKDGIVFEKTTASPWVVTSYAHCIYAGIFEFGDGGTLEDAIFDHDRRGRSKGTRWSTAERLRVSFEAASGLADLQTLASVNGTPGIYHADFSHSQILLVEGKYKLNDFNLAYFMRKRRKTGEICGAIREVGNPEKRTYKAPEQYRRTVQSDKTDVFNLGSLLYMILTARNPFEGLKQDQYIRKILRGEMPWFGTLEKDGDPAVAAMIHAIKWCRRLRQKDRPSAKDVAEFLAREVEKINGASREVNLSRIK